MSPEIYHGKQPEDGRTYKRVDPFAVRYSELEQELAGKDYEPTDEQLAATVKELEEDEDDLRWLSDQVASDPDALRAYYNAHRRAEEIRATLAAEGFDFDAPAEYSPVEQ